jgi:hypothetical protein
MAITFCPIQHPIDLATSAQHVRAWRNPAHKLYVSFLRCVEASPSGFLAEISSPFAD